MPWKPKTHKTTVPRSTASRERGRFYSSAKWRKLRAAILKRDVECQHCHERPADCVDHVNNDHRDNRPENLMGTCRSCHGRKTLVIDMRGPQPAPAEEPVRQFPEDYRFA